MLGPDPGDLVPLPSGGEDPPSPDLVQSWYLKLASAMLNHPGADLYELAKIMGKRPAWVATIKNSDMFQEYYKKRYNAVVDGIQKKTATMVELAVDRIIDRVETFGDVMGIDDLNEIADKGAKRLGFGPAAHPGLAVTVGVAVGRGDLEEARQRMQARFGVTPEAALVTSETSSQAAQHASVPTTVHASRELPTTVHLDIRHGTEGEKSRQAVDAEIAE
jgi:hypothetical protein